MTGESRHTGKRFQDTWRGGSRLIYLDLRVIEPSFVVESCVYLRSTHAILSLSRYVRRTSPLSFAEATITHGQFLDNSSVKALMMHFEVSMSSQIFG